MKILLKKDWDLSVVPPTRQTSFSGHFAGRKKEISQLVNEIMRRNSGAILVSGHRGVGKTSMVYQALNTSIKNDNNLIVVLMNAAQLEVDSEKTEINPKKIIENLIRRLYSVSAVRSIPANKKIEELYKKAVAKETEYKELIQHIDDQEKIELIEENIQIKASEISKNTLSFLVSWTLAVSYQLSGFNFFGNSVVDKLIPLFLSFPIPYAFNYFFNKTRTNRKTIKQSQEVAEIYKFDNAVGNLEFDLENIHSEIAKNNHKLIYVIDELDKLDVNQVKSVLKYFKNLFTLSEAIFIFIGGEELLTLGGIEKLGNREKEYTYFTSRYYLSRPMWGDLSEYLNNIIFSHDISDNDFENFKRAVCFDSANDFFDIRSQIRDRITGFDADNYPEISFVNSDSDLDLVKSRFHQALSTLYEEKYMFMNPLKWNDNEKLLRVLFTRAYEVQKSYAGYPVNDSRNGELNDQILRDFNKLLHRLEVLQIQAETSTTINNLPVPVRDYVVTGRKIADPPTRMSEPTEFESRFIQAFSKYGELVVLVSNILLGKKVNKLSDFLTVRNNKVFDDVNQLGVNLYEIYETQFKIYTCIVNQTYPYPYQRENVDENTKTVEQFYKNILTTQLKILLPRLIKKIIENKDLEITVVNNNANLFSGAALSIKEVLVANRVIPEVLFAPDYSRQMLFVNSKIELMAQHRDILEDIAKTHRIVYLLSEENKKRVDNLDIFYLDASSLDTLSSGLDALISESKRFFELNT